MTKAALLGGLGSLELLTRVLMCYSWPSAGGAGGTDKVRQYSPGSSS